MLSYYSKTGVVLLCVTPGGLHSLQSRAILIWGDHFFPNPGVIIFCQFVASEN